MKSRVYVETLHVWESSRELCPRARTRLVKIQKQVLVSPISHYYINLCNKKNAQMVSQKNK